VRPWDSGEAKRAETYPWYAAHISGELPDRSCLSIFAPRSSSTLSAAKWFFRAAHSSAVLPSVLLLSMSNSSVVFLPRAAARCAATRMLSPPSCPHSAPPCAGPPPKPLSRMIFTMWSWPLMLAAIRAVLPSFVVLVTSAPCFRSSLTTFGCPSLTAHIKGVLPSEFAFSSSAPAARRSLGRGIVERGRVCGRVCSGERAECGQGG
jgi:hypothetical protein